MLTTRVIPVLLLRDGALVKTARFDTFKYVGDPINTVRIFNELEVDELILLDIVATKQHRAPDLHLLSEIADECFMPLSYGGGVRSLENVRRIFEIGLEKVVINSYAVENPEFISQVAKEFGSQSVIGSIDVRKGRWRGYEVYTVGGSRNAKLRPVEWARRLERLGVGEILLTSVEREGTWAGYDIELIRAVSEAVTVPVIAHGGAGTLRDLEEAVKCGRASALALGSMVVYQARGLGVLINFPEKAELAKCLI